MDQELFFSLYMSCFNRKYDFIALMGTSLTKEQVQVIKGMRAKIVLMFDKTFKAIF